MFCLGVGWRVDLSVVFVLGKEIFGTQSVFAAETMFKCWFQGFWLNKLKNRITPYSICTYIHMHLHTYASIHICIYIYIYIYKHQVGL